AIRHTVFSLFLLFLAVSGQAWGISLPLYLDAPVDLSPNQFLSPTIPSLPQNNITTDSGSLLASIWTLPLSTDVTISAPSFPAYLWLSTDFKFDRDIRVRLFCPPGTTVYELASTLNFGDNY